MIARRREPAEIRDTNSIEEDVIFRLRRRYLVLALCGVAVTVLPAALADLGFSTNAAAWVQPGPCPTPRPTPVPTPRPTPVPSSVPVPTETQCSMPTSASQCKDGGWQTFGVFKNQGACVAFVQRAAKGARGG
jgi:hypothetical protein